jgi:hypothetical protein
MPMAEITNDKSQINTNISITKFQTQIHFNGESLKLDKSFFEIWRLGFIYSHNNQFLKVFMSSPSAGGEVVICILILNLSLSLFKISSM